MILGFYLIKVFNFPKIVTNILVITCAITSMSELAKRQELISAIALTFLLFFLLPLFFRLTKFKNIAKSLLYIGVFFILLIPGLIWLEHWYIKNEFPRYTKMVKYSGFWPDATKAWDWLNSNTKGNNIAYVGRPVPFPLYGTNFKNNVYYVSVNKTEPAKFHYYLNSYYEWGYDILSLHKSLEAKNNYRWGADYSVWLNNLRKRKTDYLFIYSLHQTKDIIFPMEDKWAKENPGIFKAMFLNQTIHIFKLIK